MPIEQILTDITSVLGAIGVISAILAHLPLPAKYAQFFARLATYAANAKFSVNVRETPRPKGDEPKLPPMFPGAGAAVLFLLACFTTGFAVQACLSTPPPPPCDPTTLATITAECSAKAFECGEQGIPKDECKAIVECDKRLDERKAECSK